MKRRKRVARRVGDVVAIPLPNGQFGYGRVYNGASIGVYDLMTSSCIDVNQVVAKPIAFWMACISTAIEKGEWPVLGRHEFNDEEECWPPAKYSQDIIHPELFRIWHKGEMRRASKEEIAGLEECVVHFPEHVIERILKEIPAPRSK